jgi:thiamine biosynthesis lipoprotein
VITVDLRDPVAPTVLDEVFRWFHRVDELFSTWRDDSEITRLGRGTLRLGDVSPEVREVLDLCEQMRAHTWGAFDVNVGGDPRVTPREGLGPIDPSGLVKGWALDRAGAMLRDASAANFAINAGGDVLVAGQPDPGEPWRIGIQHPSQRDKVACVVLLTDAGVATSGRYERGDHVIDPRTGQPAVALTAVSVVAHDLAIADGCATGILALGEESRSWLGEHPDHAVLTIAGDGVVTSSPAFDRFRAGHPW